MVLTYKLYQFSFSHVLTPKSLMRKKPPREDYYFDHPDFAPLFPRTIFQRNPNLLILSFRLRN